MTFEAGIALDVAALAVEPNLPNLGLVVVDALTLGAGKRLGKVVANCSSPRAGGNKVVMMDTKGKQTILISNSNNKGTAVQVSFQGDGSITIQSNGPVTVLSPTITLEAGEKGTIKLHAKTITLEAEELARISSRTTDVELVAKEVLAYQGQKVNGKALEQMSLDGGTKLTADSADSQYL